MENHLAMSSSKLNRYVDHAHKFLKELAEELGLDPHNKDGALHYFRLVMHTLRDRLSPEESLDLISELPIILKGVYVDGWKTARKPVKRYRKLEDFLQDLMERSRNEFATPEEALRVAKAVLRVVKRHISEGEWQDIVKTMPEDLRPLFEVDSPA